MADITGDPILDLLQSMQTATNLIMTVVTGRLQRGAHCPQGGEKERLEVQEAAKAAVFARRIFS